MSRIDVAEALVKGYNHRESGLAGLSPSERLTLMSKAHQAVADALRDGSLVRGPCEVCGSTDGVQGHHDDYHRQLEVRWLCKLHHGVLHVDERAPRELNLRQVRELRGLSLRQVEAETGFSRATLSMIETGKRVPTPLHMLALSDLYGVAPGSWRLVLEYRYDGELAA